MYAQIPKPNLINRSQKKNPLQVRLTANIGQTSKNFRQAEQGNHASQLGGIEKDKKRMAKQLTETDALAVCIAPVLDGTKSFGAPDAEKACLRLAELFGNKQVDAATFARVNSRIGNHSALRQWAIKQGFIPASNVPADALARAVKQIHAGGDATLKKMLE